MKQKRIVSRFTFALTVFTMMAVMTSGELMLAVAITVRLGLRGHFIGCVFGGFAFVNFVLARAIADRLFKAIGLSRSGQLVEGRKPASHLSESLPAEDVVEIRSARAPSNAMTLVMLGFVALIFVFSEVIIPKHQQTGRESLPMLYGIFLGLAALGYLVRYSRFFRIDDQGVTAVSGRFSTGRTTIPWSRIASCDLVVIHNTFGKVSAAYPVIKGAEGKDLFRGLEANLTTASPMERQRVLQIFMRRFPKLDLDPWEL